MELLLTITFPLLALWPLIFAAWRAIKGKDFFTTVIFTWLMSIAFTFLSLVIATPFYKDPSLKQNFLPDGPELACALAAGWFVGIWGHRIGYIFKRFMF